MLIWAAVTSCHVVHCAHAMQVNAGAVMLHNISPNQSTLEQLTGPLTCDGTEAGQAIPQLAAGAAMTCYGSFTFDQAAFESGPRTFTAGFRLGEDPGSGLVPQLDRQAATNGTVTPLAVAVVRGMIDKDSCEVPVDAGEGMACAVAAKAEKKHLLHWMSHQESLSSASLNQHTSMIAVKVPDAQTFVLNPSWRREQLFSLYSAKAFHLTVYLCVLQGPT